MANKIETGHTRDEYLSKYGTKIDSLVSFSEKEVEEFDVKNNSKEKILLKDKKWWLIDGVYYQIPSPKKPKKGVIALISVLSACAVGAAVAVPIILLQKKDPEPVKDGFTVTFDSLGGSYIKSQIVAKGKCVSKPSNPTLEGNEFRTWKYEGEDFDFATPIEQDITLTASWDILFHHVTFTVDGMTYYETDITHNSYAKKPSDPVSETKVFTGWKLEGGTDYFEFDLTKVDQNLTLVAQWDSTPYKVEFKLNESTTLETKTALKTGTTIVTPLTSSEVKAKVEDKIYQDSDVIGWYTDLTKESTLVDFTKPITKDMTVYPKWKVNVKGFTIFGDHNIDVDSRVMFQAIYSDNGNEEEICDLTFTSLNDKCIYDSLNLVESKDSSTTGSDVLTFERTYSDPEMTESTTISQSFEVEIASFNKLDKSELEKGVAKAVSQDIEGVVYIPKRYYSETKGEWVTITSIAQGGFEGCTKVTDVHIPVPTITIGNDSFKGCETLSKIDFEDKTNTWNFTYKDEQGVEQTIEINPADPSAQAKIVEAMKKGGSSLKIPTKTGLTFILNEDGTSYSARQDDDASTDIPEDVLIPAYVYKDEESGEWVTTYKEGKSKPVTELNYDASKEDAKGAFQGCKTIKTFTVHPQSNLKSIGDSAFRETSLEEVNFSSASSEKIEYIGSDAFHGATNLKSIALPNQLQSISPNAFNGCGITKIILPDSIKNIGESAFSNCKSLSDVTYPKSESLNYIKSNCFRECTNLKSFTVPSNVGEIQTNAFFGVTLSSLIFEDATSTWAKKNDSGISEQFYIKARKNSVTAKSENATKLNTIGDCVLTKNGNDVSVPMFTFGKNEELNGYEIVQYIGEGYTEVDVPSTYLDIAENKTYPIVNIHEGAFKENKELVSVSIPNSIQHIEREAFISMPNLTTINLPKNSKFTTIEEKTFMNTPKLKHITIPSNVKKICSNAFALEHTAEGRDALNQGLETADFGVSDITWTSNNISIFTKGKTSDDETQMNNVRANAISLRSNNSNDWVKSNSKTDENEDTIWYMMLKDTFSFNDRVSPDNFFMGVSSKGHYTENILDKKAAKYYFGANICQMYTCKYEWTEVLNNESKSWGTDKVSTKNFKMKSEYKHKGTFTTKTYSTYTKESPNTIKLYWKAPTEDKYFNYKEITNDNSEIIGYEISANSDEKLPEEVIIPCSHNNKPVLSVGNSPKSSEESTGFIGSTTMKRITLPDSILNIGKGAFANNTVLEKVNLSKNLVNIMPSAFYNCPKLSSLYLPKTLKYFGEMVSSDGSETLDKVYFKKICFLGYNTTWYGLSNTSTKSVSFIPFSYSLTNLSYLKAFDAGAKTDLSYDPADVY